LDTGDFKEEEEPVFAFSTSLAAFLVGIMLRNEEENSGLRAILVASE
jgi:hypothetical protein